MQPSSPSVLNPRQLARIEAVHRGFMYQHLFAVACLLVAPRWATAVQVEKDEDIEVDVEEGVIYVQVKTRLAPLAVTDVQSTLERFDTLRDAHRRGARTGAAKFVIVSNTEPAPRLRQLLESGGTPPDITLCWPEGRIGPLVERLPPAWTDISAAASWCITAAEALPQRLISAESLVWKLAAHVALASSGEPPYEAHRFPIAHLPTLFEQFLLQLQDFPEPLQHYRPQRDEPDLHMASRVRIISGFSGAGKTSWAAQAAAHASSATAYYDASDTPAAALASALVRECAAQLAGSNSLAADKILAPGATGLEALRALDVALRDSNRSSLLVLDNAHKVDAPTLVNVLQATSHMKIVLLGHPTAVISELEALTGVAREELKGWSVEDVAAEAALMHCRGPLEAMDRLRSLTAGYPLFVQGALRLTAKEYAGDVALLCDTIQQLTHEAATAQEVILARVFDSLTPDVQKALAHLSASDLPLKREEAVRMLRECMGSEAAAVAAVVRQMRLLGLLQNSGADSVRIHDAIRILARQLLHNLGGDEPQCTYRVLRQLVLESLLQKRDTSRIGMFARILAALNDLEPLIDLMGEELFHEIGVIPEVTAALRSALAAGQLTQEQQYWAYDGLIFAALKHGDVEKKDEVHRWLEDSEKLLTSGKLSASQCASLCIKRMLYEATKRNVSGVMEALERAETYLPNDRTHYRIFTYNAAAALYSIGEHQRAYDLAAGVVAEYYEVLGINPEKILGLKQPELWKALGPETVDISNVKHLADALELLALSAKKLGGGAPLARLHAMRFYELCGAVDSVVRTGLDVADDFVWRNDFIGARKIMEQHVLPYIKENHLVARILDARSLYAVILAYCGFPDQADHEMRRLAPLVHGAPEQMQKQIHSQIELIAEVRAKGPPPQLRIRQWNF
ncbi:TPA: AAA family ATPase [Pseudomonas aeruginosa]